MTPRIVLFALPEDMTVRAVVDEHKEFRFSRIPVYTETRDDVTGYVLTDEILLKAAQEQGDRPLKDLKREILVVPDNLRLHALFERMLDRLEHIALVVDEYGGVEGVVSMEDVVETLLGLEIVDEADSAEDMQMLARRQWLSRAKRLGIVPKEIEGSETELASVLQYGITGGAAPKRKADEQSEGSEGSSGRGSDRTESSARESGATNGNSSPPGEPKGPRSHGQHSESSSDGRDPTSERSNR